jgi:hypothetical protein
MAENLNGSTKAGKTGVVFMVGSSVKGGNGTGTELLAWVARVDIIRSARPARVLPETTPLVPVKTKTPKDIGGGTMAATRKIQPNTPPQDFSQFKLLGQLGLQQVQNGLRGQFAVGVVRPEGAGF